VFGIARAAGALSRATGRGGGGTIPGRVTLALRPTALRDLTAGRTVALVSGTNGKTTTTRFLATAVGARHTVVTNTGGANLMAGLVSAFLPEPDPAAVAVLEVDEAVLPAAITATSPRVVVLLNLSRDQLDRYEEVGSHITRWATALRAQPDVRVVANADDPLVVAVVLRAEVAPESVTWVAAGAPWRSDAPLCPVCGHAWDFTAQPWSCASCGAQQPEASWHLDGTTAIVDPAGASLPLDLAIEGRAAAANAVMAAAGAQQLGIAPDVAVRQLSEVRDVDGRYLRQVVGGRQVTLLLAKNPAGWLEVLDQLTSRPGELVLGINAKTADGTDPSWLWDVPFEVLRGREVVVFGERALDLSVRLHYAEVPHTMAPSLMTALRAKPAGEALVAANYTAFVAARAALRQVAS
jgi:UDP-N-acetylmuramyl tripeptide synthase